MKSYQLILAEREAGPYSEQQVAQLFADGRADRNTPCRLATGGDWKTIDDYLPMLKYGTQLPQPTASAPPVTAAFVPPQAPLAAPSVAPGELQVSVVDFEIPFLSMLKLMFKWMAAAFIVFCCFLPAVFLLIFIVMGIFGSLLNGMISGLHHP